MILSSWSIAHGRSQRDSNMTMSRTLDLCLGGGVSTTAGDNIVLADIHSIQIFLTCGRERYENITTTCKCYYCVSLLRFQVSNTCCFRCCYCCFFELGYNSRLQKQKDHDHSPQRTNSISLTFHSCHVTTILQSDWPCTISAVWDKEVRPF